MTGNAPRPTELYRHYDKDGYLLYVGVAYRTSVRMGQHRASAHWAKDVYRTEVERFDSRQEALEAERTAIRGERPLFNKMLNQNPGERRKRRARPSRWFVRQHEDGKVVGFLRPHDAFRHFVNGDQVFAKRDGLISDDVRAAAASRDIEIQIGDPRRAARLEHCN